MRRAARKKRTTDARQFDLFAKAELPSHSKHKMGVEAASRSQGPQESSYEAEVLSAIIRRIERQWSHAVEKRD